MLNTKPEYHLETAQALYQQRCQLLELPLVEAHFLAQLENQLSLHLHTLQSCPEAVPPAQCRASAFIALAMGQIAGDSRQRDKTLQQGLELLTRGGELQQAAFDAFSLFPQHDHTRELLDFYHQHPSLRPLLFDLWRDQQVPIPAALTSVAELREQDLQLQVAALRYAASRPECGTDLFLPYFEGLTSGNHSSRPPGALLATALWGALLRGTERLDKPLWRSIETEIDADALYHLLRLGALLANPNLIQVITPFSQKQPARVAEILALHGTKEAIEALVALSPKADKEPEILASWLWLSGQPLTPAPHLRLVTSSGKTPPPPATIEHWWQQHKHAIQPGQRLLTGEITTPEHLHRQCYRWAGRYSRNLLDLLAFQRRTPLPVNANGLQSQRRQILNNLRDNI